MGKQVGDTASKIGLADIFRKALAAILVVGFITVLLTALNIKAVDYSKYNLNQVIVATEDNGQIGDHIKGSKDAPVVLIEYADFQCGGCAMMNPKINKIVEDSNGKLAVVYRNFLLQGHPNATAAASAAEAAGLQGYWKAYSDLLFKNQAEWFDARGETRLGLLKKYFEEASEGKGDMGKFERDLSSEAVKKKISFDMGVAKKTKVSMTPSLYIDGKLINWANKTGGSLEINGRTVAWTEQIASEEAFTKLLNDIVKAKLGE